MLMLPLLLRRGRTGWDGRRCWVCIVRAARFGPAMRVDWLCAGAVLGIGNTGRVLPPV